MIIILLLDCVLKRAIACCRCTYVVHELRYLRFDPVKLLNETPQGKAVPYDIETVLLSIGTLHTIDSPLNWYI